MSDDDLDLGSDSLDLGSMSLGSDDLGLGDDDDLGDLDGACGGGLCGGVERVRVCVRLTGDVGCVQISTWVCGEWEWEWEGVG